MSRSRGSVQARLEHLLGVQAQRLAGLRQAGQCRGADARVTSENLNLIGLLRAGLEEGDMPGIPADAVGYGSKVWLQNLDNLETSAHRIMSGEAMDLEDGHVSLDSALGSSLMGLRVGAKVEARTPGGPRRFRIEGLETLHELLDALEAGARPPGTSERVEKLDLEEVGL